MQQQRRPSDPIRRLHPDMLLALRIDVQNEIIVALRAKQPTRPQLALLDGVDGRLATLAETARPPTLQRRQQVYLDRVLAGYHR